VSRTHQLHLTAKLPAQKVVLSSVDNKKQLIKIICDELARDRLFHTSSTRNHKLVITGEDPCPVQVSNEDISVRHDLETSHEEADIIIVQQALKCASEASKLSVVSDDTDVFVLLVHFYKKANLTLQLTMESPSKEKTIVDIKQTVVKHDKIVNELLPAHALSGCDTVACYFGLGKGCVLKTLKAGFELLAVGDIEAPFTAVMEQATTFISACYGMKKAKDMSETRLLVWGKKNGKGHTSSPKLCTLPPTKEAFTENVKRAHYQAILWRMLETSHPPALDPEEYGWMRDVKNKSLSPITVPDDVKLAPEYVLEMIRCGCKSESPCNSRRCGCQVRGLPCTIFCACYAVGCSRVQ